MMIIALLAIKKDIILILWKIYIKNVTNLVKNAKAQI